jgi:hypothetical protein
MANIKQTIVKSTLLAPKALGVLGVLGALVLTSCSDDNASPQDLADVLYINGNIWTGVDGAPLATTLATKGNIILAVGDGETLGELKGKNTQTIDLKGQTLVPGFIDNHTHFMETSVGLSMVKLRDAKTPQEFSDRIEEFARVHHEGFWITGGDWDHENWGGTLPTKEWVDRQTLNNPLFVSRLDGHMALVNSQVLKLAGIDKDTPDIEGGEIVRDPNGNPTGILKDAAMELVLAIMPKPSLEAHKDTLKNGVAFALSHGVTQIHNMGTWEDLDAFESLKNDGDLTLRVYSFVPLNTWQQLSDFTTKMGKGDDWHRWGGLKGLVDGSLGSTTAYFYEPYSDEPDKTGFSIHPFADFYSWMSAGHQTEMQLAIHAIGDKANDWVLDSFEKLSQDYPKPNTRYTIEHAQHLTPEAIKRFSPLGVIPSMQPYHAIDDGRWAEKRIGAERLKGTYAFKSLLDNDARLTFGSDSPVAPMNVMAGIYAAVTRATLDDKNPDGWMPEQKISVEAALKAYTLNNAYAGNQETKLGTLIPGKLADFVVLNHDIFTINPTEIINTKVVYTIVGGVKRYAQP